VILDQNPAIKTGSQFLSIDFISAGTLLNGQSIRKHPSKKNTFTQIKNFLIHPIGLPLFYFITRQEKAAIT
jgi:hypothetical protein